MTTATNNYGWLMPDPGGSANTWGNVLNGATQAIDAALWSITNAPVTFNGAVTFAAAISGTSGSFSGTLTSNGWFYAGDTNFCLFANSVERYLNFAPDWFLGWNTSTGRLRWVGNTGSPTELMWCDGNGNFGTHGGIAANGNITASNTVTGAQITSTGNINASGTVSGAQITSTQITSTGNINASGTVSGAQLTSSGNINANAMYTAGLTSSGFISTAGLNSTNVIQVRPGDNSITANAGGQYVMINGSSGFGGSSSFILNGGGRSYAFEWYYGSTQIAEMGGDGSLFLNGPTGQKVSGATWSNPSDARIKNVIGDYTAGLAEVLQLNPVTFTFKDNYTREAGAASPHATLARDRTPCAGLIAQEVEAIFPEMVTKSEAYLDGRKVSDFRNLDTSNLILALVNSVKELKAEIEALKASR